MAEVIEKHFGIDLSISSVWRLMGRMGWSNQKPERVAKEKDEEEIEKWRKEEWPRIKKRKIEGRYMVFIDESGHVSTHQGTHLGS